MKRIFLLLPCLIFSVINSYSESVWNGTASMWTKGSGTATDQYQIQTAQNLAYLAQSVNSGNSYSGKYFVLTDDINLNNIEWTPIGDDSHKFEASFDGAGHTISKLKATESHRYNGLFGYVTKSIKNINVNGNISNGQFSGGIVGYSMGSISQCSYTGTVSSSSLYNSYSGGIVGYLNSSTCTISQCSNTGTISSMSSNNASYSGGIVGYSKASISQCSNTGSVSSETGSGGIVGYMSPSTSYISQCSNAGTISASSSKNGSSYSGGIVGYSYYSTYTISQCFNTGTISFSGCTYSYPSYTGGISGYGGNISYSYNSGKVETSFSSTTGWKAPHLFSAGIAYNATITNSYNVGSLVADGKIVEKYAVGNSTCTNSYYLESCGSTAGGGTSKTATFMRSESFPTLLNGSGNTVFIQDVNNINDRYPIFGWQGVFSIIFVNYNGGELQREELKYGDTPKYKGETPVKPADAQYTYTFSGWNPNVAAVTGPQTYTAQYTSTTNKYTIRFLNDNGDVLQSESLDYGATPEYKGSEPTKPATAQYTYAFAGWDKTITTVTEATDYTATYNSTVNKYEIKFVNYDGEELQSEEFDYGDTPEYKGQTPVKPADAHYTYTFSGWEPEIAEVTEAKTYTAQFSSTTNKYTVRFLNDNGEVLQSESLDYGATPEYKGSEPTKPATAQYTYTFNGWDKTIAPVDGAADYTATYTATVNKYEITFVNYDGKELQSSTVDYGNTPEYTGETPTKPADVQYTYTFSGWEPEVVAVTGAQTYTAQYASTVNSYTVRFLNEDGTVLQTESLEYGTVPTYKGEEPAKPATAQYTYTFAGWDNAIAPVDDDADYTATYSSVVNKYEVKFVNYDGEELQSEEFDYGVTPTYKGQTPVKPADAQYRYTFSGWEPEIVEVTEPNTYTAQYTSTNNKYIIRFLNDNGDVLQSESLDYGATPEYKGSVPTKPATAQYTYAFAGWDKTITTVTEATDYTATYNSTVNKYEIKFVNYDGEESQSEELDYGATPKYKGQTPVKPADAQYTYIFSGWSPEIVEVTEAKTYTAQFSNTTNKYTIRFLNDNGDVLQSESLDYGNTPEYKGSEPTKPATAQYTYAFAGWDKVITTVTEATDYTAIYSSVVNKYEIKFVNCDGEELQSEELEYGATPEYKGQTPVKPSDAQYTYTFNGWSPEITEVTGLQIYTAQFSSTTNKYTVRFLNDDGYVLQSESLDYGTTPEYKGSEPTKPATAQYTYTFDGWDKAITSVTEATDYTATYNSTVNKYEIKFVNYDGEELQSEELDYGVTPEYKGQTPVKPADAQYTYTFSGWSPEIAEVTEAKTYTAQFSNTTNKYTVRFLNDNGDVLQSENLDYGATPEYKGSTPTKPTTAQYTYTFAGWDKTITTVTEATDYTATYNSVVNKYEIKFVNYDGEELQSEELDYGATPEYKGQTPVKPADAQYTYIFIGWSPEIAEVTEAKTYTAQFSSTTNKYTIRFLNDDGDVLQSESLDYGATPEYKGLEPTKPATAQYTYTFNGWDKAITTVTEATDYTATYSSVVNKYEIKFVNYDGEELQSEELEYGATPEYKGQTPVKPADAQYTYTFSGWEPEIAEVTEPKTYTAQFSSITNKYTVKTIAQTEGVTTGDGVYDYGETATLTATPNEGYEFTYWSNGEKSSAIHIIITKDTTLTAYFQFIHCTVEKDIDVSVPEGGEITLKSGKTIFVTKSQRIDDLKVTPLKCDSLFHYNITMIRQSADNTPACDNAPSVAKYDWLFMINVKALNAQGYAFGEGNVSWYRIVGEMDNIDDPASMHTDQLVGKGYGYTIDKSFVGTGDYYALIDLPKQTSEVGCKGIMRTQVFRYGASKRSAPAVIPTIAYPNQRMQVMHLPQEENCEIYVYDNVGKLCRHFASHGADTAEFEAEMRQGSYIVVIQSADGTESVKYIVK